LSSQNDDPNEQLWTNIFGEWIHQIVYRDDSKSPPLKDTDNPDLFDMHFWWIFPHGNDLKLCGLIQLNRFSDLSLNLITAHHYSSVACIEMSYVKAVVLVQWPVARVQPFTTLHTDYCIVCLEKTPSIAMATVQGITDGGSVLSGS